MTRRRPDMAWLLISVVFSLAGCGRGREIWSGAQEVDDGQRLMIAAQVSLCGCITLENVAGTAVTISASRGNAVVGRAVLPPRGRMSVRFDWAGDSDDDVYILEAVNPRGGAMAFDRAVRVVGFARWTDCSRAGCQFAPLGMNVAVTGRVPGER